MEYDNTNFIKNNIIIKTNNNKQDNFVDNTKLLLSEITEINQIHDYVNHSLNLYNNQNLNTNLNTNLNANSNANLSPINTQNIKKNTYELENNEQVVNKNQINFEKKKLCVKNDILSPKLILNESNCDEIFLLYKDLVKEFNDFNDVTIKGLLKLKLSIKKFEKIINKSSLNKKTNFKNNEWGFTEQRIIPKSIELFFNIKQNSKLSRTDIGKLFQEYIKDNNLKGNINCKNKLDKRIYRVDDKLSKLFRLSDEEKNKINSCNSSNIKFPHGFNFYNYQTWIKKIYIEEFSDDKKSN